VNNIDVTAALKPLTLPQYQLHQAADGSLRLKVAAPSYDEPAIRAALASIFGPAAPLTIEPLDPATTGKLAQYSRDSTPATTP
jgi:phenylacetate-CoA ligase